MQQPPKFMPDKELSKVGDLYDTISIPGDKEGYDAIVREIMSKRGS